MAKKDKGKDSGRDWRPWLMGTRVDIPEPKGKFRNAFEDVIEQMRNRTRQNPNKRTCDCGLPMRDAAGSE